MEALGVRYIAQGALASRKCATLVSLQLGELAIQICDAIGGCNICEVVRFKQKGPDFSNTRKIQRRFRSFTGEFANLLRAARKRQCHCQLLDVFMKGWITANSNGQSMASCVPSRELTARDGTRAGAFFGIVAIGGDFSIRRHGRYSAASVNSPSMISEEALPSLRAMLSLCRSNSLKIALRRYS
jgi:hypothetical protein